MYEDEEGFDDYDLWELIQLAAYLEGKAKRGLFPKARYYRYSDALVRLIALLADEHPTANTAGIFQGLLKPPPASGAKILTHPRFRGRKK